MTSGETAMRAVQVDPPPAEPSFFFPAAGQNSGAGRDPASGQDAGAAQDAAPEPAPRYTLLRSDAAAGSDDLGRVAQAEFLAELLTHRQVETPLCLGLFGPAGSGKSFFLSQILSAADRASQDAAALGEASPFVEDLLTVRIDASDGSEAGASLAASVFDALASRYPRLAAETSHAGGDPIKAARDAGEALNESRRRLEAERQSLEALGGRQARLTETVLFEAAGSQVDAYARRNRTRIERALRSFGFSGNDPVTTYKELVREAAETDSPLARFGLGLRSLWAYQWQTRLILVAILFGLVAWGVATIRGDQAGWLTSIRDLGDHAGPVAGWAETHFHWLKPIQTLAVALAVLALLWNVGRAGRFLQPIFKGVGLLRRDIDGRRRDINSLLAHQTRRVDSLAAEVEQSATLADEAERRATQHKAAGLDQVRLHGDDRSQRGGQSASAFLASLGAAMKAAHPDGRGGQPYGGQYGAPMLAQAGTAPRLEDRQRTAPRRIVVAIDGLDQLPSNAAATFVKATRRLLAEGFIGVVVADRDHLAAGFAETDPALASAQLGRCVQLAYVVGSDTTEAARAGFAKRLLEGVAGQAADGRGADGFDPRRSVLDQPWRPREIETVTALAPFAGESPRAVKRFVNTYKVARADPHLRDAAKPVFTALALALALEAHGFPDDLAALESASHGEAPWDSAVLRQALAAARAASEEPVELAQAQQGLRVARHYSLRG